MGRSLRYGAMALALGSLLGAGSAAAGEKLAPELPTAATGTGQPFSLEDLRGQLTVLVFYDDTAS
jgi:cytochrome oxidase Cu insertion factor (SCO1/SenC/PrrC family)